MDARFSRPMEAWSRCSPAEQVTTDSCEISSQRVDKILFYSRVYDVIAYNQSVSPDPVSIVFSKRSPVTIFSHIFFTFPQINCPISLIGLKIWWNLGMGLFNNLKLVIT